MPYSKEELKTIYDKQEPLFKRVCLNIQEALTIFFVENRIQFLTISARVKDFESFFEKAHRKNYKNPFSDNEDFCGVRVILYHLEDIEKVKTIIEKEFEVNQDEDKTRKLHFNEFGYRSFHFIVSIKKQWLSTPNYRGLKDIKIEIQVRTILMHAWAEIEHKLGYKSKEQIPTELKRKLYMISAKLEEADGQFQDMKDSIEKYTKALVIEATKNGSFNIEDFNLNSLQALLDFYFPAHEAHPALAASLFSEIKEYKLSPQQIVQYAEKIQPFVDLLNKRLYGEHSDTKTNQSNILSYAIETFYEKANLTTPSEGRKKVINYLKRLVSNNL